MHFQTRLGYFCNVILPAILMLLLAGCHTEKIKARNIEFDVHDDAIHTTTFSNEDIQVKHLVLQPENIYGNFTQIIVVDSFLVCGNSRSSKLLSIYSLKGDTLVAEVIPRGTAQHEGLSVGGLSSKYPFFASRLWVYDITLGKLFRIDIAKAIQDTNYLPDREITLTKEMKNIVSPAIIDDSLLIATTYTWDDNRYLYANETILKKIGKLPLVTDSGFLRDVPDSKFPNKAYLLKAFSIKNPLDNRVAVFYNKTARAEFYSNDSLMKSVVGPDQFGPMMRVAPIEAGFSIEDFDQTKYAYTSVAYTPDAIYCLYSGTDKDDACSNRILVFSWDGNIREELRLDKKVCKICINPGTKVLYCYDSVEKGIYSVSLEKNITE